MWWRIRAFEARSPTEDTVVYKNRYELEKLLEQIAAGTAKPTYLPEFDDLSPLQALLLAWVVTCCFIRKAPAIDGTNLQWSEVLACSEYYAPEVLEWLCRRRWLIRRPRFLLHPGTGRSREKVEYIETASWYSPGLRLNNAWIARCAERELYAHWLHKHELDQPILTTAPAATGRCSGQEPDPSAIQSRILTTRAHARTRTRARSDGTCGALKESPQAATSVETPTESAHGAQGPVKESPQAATSVERRAPRAADQEGVASLVPGQSAAPKTAAAVAGGGYRDSARDIALISRLATSKDDARRLIANYRELPESVMSIVEMLAAERGLI